MLGVFLDVILPVLLVATIGGWAARRAGMTVRPLAALTFNVFTPALVFDALRGLRAEGDTVAGVIAVVVVAFFVLALMSVLWSRAAGHDRPTLAAVALCAAVANMGNLGLPVSQLAFGRVGLDIAVVAFVTSSVLANSGGIVIASLASSSVRDAIRAPLRVPALWAALAALAVNVGEIPVPDMVTATTSTLAGAAIPAMLVVLGLQVTRGAVLLGELPQLAVPLVLRLGASPAIVAGAATLVGVDGVARRTLVVLGGMPTAVNTTIIATHYQARPPLVTRVVVASSLLSILTLTILVTLLR